MKEQYCKNNPSNNESDNIRHEWDQYESAQPVPNKLYTVNELDEKLKDIKNVPERINPPNIQSPRSEPVWKYCILALFIGLVGWGLLGNIIDNYPKVFACLFLLWVTFGYWVT